MSSRMDLMDLARHLRQESLFVSSEKQSLQHLNEKVVKAAENLYHLSWIARQQRLTLDNLLLSHTDSHLANSCNRSNLLETVNFIDSYKQLGINDNSYSEFLQQFRETPKFVASCLNYGEKIDISVMHNVVNIIMAAIYGNCILPEDEVHALILLRELMSLQLAESDNPRRLLRHGSCAFSRVYKIFSECLFSAKIFLTAALHEPIMHLLMADDLFLDIDPSKAAVRFHPQERLRHFGKEGTPEYAASLQRYRNWTINKLVNITNRFIEEIRNNLYCFPQSLSWLARQMYNIVMKAKRVEVREVGAMCADLVFAFFICPAIVDPESYGITDIPISYIARFNLMQVAQILQVLAMSKWEEIDPKLMDLYGKFEKDCMSSLLDLILEGSSSDSPADLVTQFQDLNRSAVLITESELITLVTFLRSVEAGPSDCGLKKTLYAMINHLPVSNVNVSSTVQNGNVGIITSTPNSSDNHPHLSSSKRGLFNKVSRKSSKLPTNLLLNSDNTPDETNGIPEGDSNLNAKAPLEDVLVVPIQGIDFDCPGMLNEDKVLAIESQKKKQSLENGSLLSEDGDTLNVGPEIIEKRTRFSLSQDQESVGTSDNLEAISEAASNHSVASSLDLENENENDNLSDMVSANVSGRGTPNVSGRDTPSSQLEDEGREQRPLDLTAPVRNQSQQENIEDKFGKFEIQPMMEGDETKSIVSDTWSTDVLASDSETVEQSDISCQVTLESQSCLERSLLDTSETASQSDAWSTDVLASDTERLQDVDTDDTASVARSDDTARSEVDSELAQNVDDAPLDRKDILDSDNIRDPFLPDQFGAIGDHQTYSHLSSSDSYSSMKQNFCSFPPFNDDRSMYTDGDVKSGDKTFNASEQLSLKVPDLLCMDIENSCDVPPIVPNSSQLSHEESLSSMQSLGRVSLAVKELPESDQDSGVMLLDSLQETVNMQNAQQAHRSSIVDILSLDLTRTLNLPASNCSSDNSLQKSESGSSLKDFEMEMYGNKMLQESSALSDFAKPTSRNAVIERGAKRKLPDYGAEDVCPQFRAVTLSNSVGNIESSSQFGNDHSDLHNSRHAKANSVPLSVGAIPKTLNYPKNIEEMDQDVEDKVGTDKHRRGLFKLSSAFRFNFKGRNRKSHPGFRSEADKDSLNEADVRASNRQSQSSFAEMRALQLEAGDEILAKYRKKSPASASNSALKASSSDFSETMSNTSDSVLLDGPHVFDPVNMENSGIFSDAKRKLRLVLGSADLQTLPWLSHSRSRSTSGGLQRLQENELVAFLKVLLAEAINLQQRPLMAHLHEALRCVRLFDDVGCQKLFKSLRDDYRKRAPYIAYLVRCRQGLLSTLSHLDTLTERVERDKQVCSQYLIMTCTRIFLEKHDRYLQYFVRKFQELVASDEKATLVENFLTVLFNLMQSDQMWQTASDIQMEHAKAVIEHSVMSQIYTSALHPNGDGDVLRDKVLHEHMQKLSQVITPNHKDLSISKVYHSECPWPSAQAELVNINAYKTPRDKIQCVLRCCSTIMNLLSIAGDKSVPAADDLMPVLVYVLIKANPPHLLSTVQYVNTFYEKQLEGEEAYWWTQFASAVEFIKNMDY